jgi:SAM-dependent methyltransferase
MRLEEFRYINTEDIFEMEYAPDPKAVPWSRVYEYPLIMKKCKEVFCPGFSIHNTSWGFTGTHVIFKNKLESTFGDSVFHSDIRPSNLSNTFVYDITKLPKQDMIEKYDIVINVSTLEEVNFDHIVIFENLFKQVKPGGYFMSTFDMPGLQLHKFEEMFDTKIQKTGTLIDGSNSRAPNERYAHLNVGFMMVQKS